MTQIIYRCYVCACELTSHKEREEGICRSCKVEEYQPYTDLLHTWMVRVPMNDIRRPVKVKAHRVELRQNVLIFYKDNCILRAFKEWRDIELLEDNHES